MKRFIIPLFIPHYGCKHQCIFCNQYNITGENSFLDIEDEIKKYINTQLKKYKRINPKYKLSQISFYGGSFTCLGEKTMEKLLTVTQKYIKKSPTFPDEHNYKIIDSLRLSTRPDCITEEILKFLKKFFVETVEIGAQALDQNILKILNRGHSTDDIFNAFALLKKFNFETGLQIMIGVPRETRKTILNSIDLIINKIKPNFIRIYPLIVIKGTMLEKMYKKKEFQPISVEEAVYRASVIHKACMENNIEVIRMGLQYSESLKNSYIAGPLISNFGEIVKKSGG